MHTRWKSESLFYLSKSCAQNPVCDPNVSADDCYQQGVNASIFFFFLGGRSSVCKEQELAAQPQTLPKVHELQNNKLDTQSANSVDMLELKHTVVFSLDADVKPSENICLWWSRDD